MCCTVHHYDVILLVLRVLIFHFSGLISGPLCQKLGCRPVAMIGGICGGTGLVLGAIVANMLQLSWCLAIAGNVLFIAANILKLICLVFACIAFVSSDEIFLRLK